VPVHRCDRAQQWKHGDKRQNEERADEKGTNDSNRTLLC
jgi:hypothetical protein